jgi:hypothetical protein
MDDDEFTSPGSDEWRFDSNGGSEFAPSIIGEWRIAFVK